MNKRSKTLLFLILLVFYSTLVKASKTFSVSEEDDSRILCLPGLFSTSSLKRFLSHLLNLFSSWLNGGPGRSSIGYGAVVELGPCKVNENRGGLPFNNFSWITAPFGVGFSYTNTSSDLTNLDDEFLAEDTYSFLEKVMQDKTTYKKINFKGFLVRNPETNNYYDSKGLLDYA
ncbi:Serine carboxypeptidase-like 26 [Bienertia sinuspersici]